MVVCSINFEKKVEILKNLKRYFNNPNGPTNATPLKTNFKFGIPINNTYLNKKFYATFYSIIFTSCYRRKFIKIKLLLSLSKMERTYIMIKPDGVQRGLVGEIISRFERKGFKLQGKSKSRYYRIC